jgi:hypothetical protein
MKNILPSDIVKEWGLESLPESKQVEMVERIGKIIYQALLVKSLDILTEKEQIEFDLLLDEDTTTPDDVMGFLQAKIPNFEKMVLEERKNLKSDLLIKI